MRPYAIISRYSNGVRSYARFFLPIHTNRTGHEDHFALACHDTEMVVTGLRGADPQAEFDVYEVSLGYHVADKINDNHFQEHYFKVVNNDER